MPYTSLEECLLDLEKNGMLIRIKEEVDPYLEMAAIQLRMYEANGPAVLFEKVKGSKFRAVSNIFGSPERSHFIFRARMKNVQDLISLKKNPIAAIKKPFKHFTTGLAALNALPLKNPFRKPVLFEEINISDLPLIQHWKDDGGAFVTLPQVYTEDIEQLGIMHANLGMYRIQLNGNDYIPNKEIGLHYQLHRGIGVHQTKANEAGKKLKVSIFVGGPPSHTVSAVMPLPEGMSELTFAGLLGGRRFRYCYKDGYCVSTDADFVITGYVENNEIKTEGPFGDHFGYYSLRHPFPLMKVHKVYARKDAIWPFTVVGRPPQEDTSFGHLIHELTGDAIQQEIPGLKEVHAVDAAGVHPLLLAIGSERYTPYAQTQQPSELLTIANHMLGKGQLSLAKYVIITSDDAKKLSAQNIPAFFQFVLERINLTRDIHFYTNTSIDTLDYSGSGLNTGSKVVIAAYGEVIRALSNEVPTCIVNNPLILNPKVCMPGIISIEIKPYQSESETQIEIDALSNQLQNHLAELNKIPLMVLTDDSNFTSETLNNFLWITFTRSNPANDIHGIASFIKNKHWGCNGPLIIDARIKPHHAPPLIKDEVTEEKIERFFKPGGVLEKWGKTMRQFENEVRS